MSKIFLTAQNIDIYNDDNLDQYARTGATSAKQIYNAGADGVILGHSEVGDAPAVVKSKFLTIVQNTDDSHFLEKITLLVGESWDEFQGRTIEAIAAILTDHLTDILKDIPQNYLENLVIGYEPKWGSRGSGHDDVPPPNPKQISIICKKIRSALVTLVGEDIGNNIPIIYGGRSTPERTNEILADENIEGLILGSACNTIEKTMDIADVMAKIRPDKRKILHANFKAFDLSDSYEEYIKTLKALDDSFTIYLSPCHADLREVKKFL